MRIVLLALTLAVSLLPLAAFAQTDAEDIAATMDAFLAAAQAGDREAAGDLMTDPFVSRVDPMEDIQTREQFLESLVDQPAPTEASLGEYEPWIGDGAAYATIPLQMPGVDTLVDEVKLGVALVEMEGAWKLAAMIGLFTLNEDSPEAAPALQALPAMYAQLEAYGNELAQLGVNGDIAEFFGLAHPEAVVGGIDEETGEMGVLTAEQMVEEIENTDEPLPGMAPSDQAEMWMEMGFGALMSAYNQDVIYADGTMETVRNVGLIGYFPSDEDGGEWLMIGAFQMPIPE
ncbi:MAG: hypothetical protein GF320_23060 [Armatimonadia bacterium]|nr:hypothetical protein [Armatimonadia bacterium]